jgi:hypothetical protein
MLAGCSVTGALVDVCRAGSELPTQTPSGQALPQFVTEWGPVCQYRPNVQDPPAERSQVLAAVVRAAIAQDVDFLALYSWAHSPVFSEGSPYWRPVVYDFRVDPVITAGLPAQVAAFHDLTLRANLPTVTVAPSLYGTMTTNAAGQAIYQQYGPYTDPALYAVPAGTKVQLSVAPTATIGTDNNVPMSVAATATIGTNKPAREAV